MSIEGLVPVFVNAVLKPEAYISALLPSTVSSGIVISILACGQFLEKKNLATRHLLTVVMLGVCAGVCLLTLALVAFISSSEVCTELAASASGGGGAEVVAADEGYNSCAANSSAAGGVGVEMVCVNPWHGSMAMVGVLGVLLLVYGACIGYAVYVPPCVFVAQFGGANSGTMMVSATALSRAALSKRKEVLLTGHLRSVCGHLRPCLRRADAEHPRRLGLDRYARPIARVFSRSAVSPTPWRCA